MRAHALLAAWTATLYLTSPAFAWNATGHRIIAAIAYERLTPQARVRVDELLQRHPDYATLFTRDAPADPGGRARAAFMAAAVWPDVIRNDARFYDDTRSDGPTPLLAGFPDMARHTNWHYFDIPYTPDGAPSDKAGPPNALSELERLLREIGGPPGGASDPSYDLPWLEHIEGDVHQPLHCVSRILKSQPKGDAGGNGVSVSPGRNLHAFWDDLAGTDTSDEYVAKFTADVTAEHPAPRRLDGNPKKWVLEGFKSAQSDVYAFGLDTGSFEHPIQLSSSYQENARRLARARIALAGYRLAAVLNARLN